MIQVVHSPFAGKATISGAGTVPAPVNTVAPVVSLATNHLGLVGDTLQVTNGTWDNAPTAYAYQWKRNSDTIVGATSNTYTITTDDADQAMWCVVTATNAGGSTPADSSNNVAPLEFHVPYYPDSAPGVSYIEGTGLVFAEGNAARHPRDIGDPYANPPTITARSYQWEQSSDGSTWATNGETSEVMAETNLSSGSYYRCAFTLTNAYGEGPTTYTATYQHP